MIECDILRNTRSQKIYLSYIVSLKAIGGDGAPKWENKSKKTTWGRVKDIGKATQKGHKENTLEWLYHFVLLVTENTHTHTNTDTNTHHTSIFPLTFSSSSLPTEADYFR